MDIQELRKILENTKTRKCKLKSFLSKESDLQDYRQSMLKLGPVNHGISSEIIAESLIVHAKKDGFNEAIYDFEAFINTDTIPGNDTLVIGGVIIEENIQLENGVLLTPYDYPVHSKEKYPFFPLLFNPQNSFDSILPRIKLTISNPSFPKLVFNNSAAANKNNQYQFKLTELEDAALLLTVIENSTPIKITKWWEPTIWTPRNLVSSTSPYHNDTPLHIIGKQLSKESLAEFKELHGHFINIQDNMIKNRLRIALKRLNSSVIWAHQNSVDAAIDMGIAIDVIFQKSGRSELTFRNASYAAWLLGKSPEERMSISKLITKIYKYRSSGVHEGDIIKDLSIIRSNLEEASKLLSNSIKKIIRLGKFPDYDYLIMGKDVL